MRPPILEIPYSTWDSVVTNNGFAVYHQVVGIYTRIWAGNPDIVYQARLTTGTDLTDWTTNHEPGSTAVDGEDDATAFITGVTNVPTTRAADGTPISAGREWTLAQAKFLRVSDGIEQMAVNGLAAGSPVVLWNGTGGSDTGGDWTHEAQGTETAGSMHAGTNGMDTGVRSASQNTRFKHPTADEDIDGTYDEITFWMQPKAFPAGARLDVQFRKFSGTAHGNKLDVASYVSDFDLDVWQKVTIPIDDFGLSQDVGKFEYTFAAVGGQHFYFDDIELGSSGGGGPHTYRVTGAANENWHVDRICMVLSSAQAGWTSSTFADLTALVNGVLVRHRDLSLGSDFWTITVKDNVGLYGKLSVNDAVDWGASERMLVMLLDPKPAGVIVTDDDVLEILIKDDLSSLINFRAFVHYGREVTT